MTLQLGRLGGITTLLVLCMLYPFLPGEHDAFAVALSTMAQLIGVVGLLLVPIGILWQVYEVKKRRPRHQDLRNTGRGYYFAVASLIVASFVAIIVSLFAFFGVGVSLGVLTIALWAYAIFRLTPKLNLLKKGETDINPTPLYLIFIPTALLIFQLALAAPLTEFSRNHAILKSAELINEIEKHRTTHGRYPSSLLAVSKDYSASVVGIERFNYVPNGDAYNLFFEQPRFLLDQIGTREFVMYNKLDEQVMPSHAAWILRWSPEQVKARQGWYAVHDAPSPHWKMFFFD